MVDTAAVTTQVAQTASQVTNIILYVILALLILGLVWFVWWMISYSKKKVVLYEKLSNGWQQKVYNAKEYRGKDNGLRWKLFKLWRKTPRPPSKSIMTDHKKRMIAHGFITDDNIVWAKLSLDFSQEKLEQIHFDPLLAEDKGLYINEIREAEKYRRKRLIDVLAGAAPVLSIIIILVVFMAFFGQVVEPSVQTGNNLVAATQKLDQLISSQASCANSVQNIGGSTSDNQNANETSKPPN